MKPPPPLNYIRSFESSARHLSFTTAAKELGYTQAAVSTHAGIIDISNFAKYEVKGPSAEAWLNALFANRMPGKVGHSCLTPLIGKRGGIAGDFTVTKLAEDEYMVFGSGMAERFHQRFFKAVP